MTPAQLAFMADLKEPALRIQAMTGLPAGMILAQAALESAWGTSGLAQRSKNLFGIKDFNPDQPNPLYSSALYPTQEFVSGQWVTIQAAFRQYATWLDSLQDYADFIFGNPRYCPALRVRNQATAYMHQLQECGYATDPAYASSVIDVYLFSGVGFLGMQKYDASTIEAPYRVCLPQ